MKHRLSPTPGVDQTADKAYVVTAVALVVFVALLWIADTGGVTAKEFVSWVVQAIIASGLLGGAAWLTPNREIHR